VTDCLKTLKAVMRSPVELARVQRDLVIAWANAAAKAEKPPRERLKATGKAAERLNPVARAVVLKTESHWSCKCHEFRHPGGETTKGERR
jgi:hypothetical protein